MKQNLCSKRRSTGTSRQAQKCRVFRCRNSPEPTAKYPGDELCNALQIGDKLLANLGAIDPYIYSFAESLGLKTIHVNQGYALRDGSREQSRDHHDGQRHLRRCTVHGTRCAAYFRTRILLNGYDYGFIGGCCGLIDRNTLGFTGALDSLQSGDYIRAFFSKACG